MLFFSLFYQSTYSLCSSIRVLYHLICSIECCICEVLRAHVVTTVWALVLMLEQLLNYSTYNPLQPQAKSALDEHLIHSNYSKLDLIFQNEIVITIVLVWSNWKFCKSQISLSDHIQCAKMIIMKTFCYDCNLVSLGLLVNACHI